MVDFAQLQGRVGEIILPDTEDYDEARHKRIWNQRLAASKHPAAIITVRDIKEAQAAINFARDNGLKLTVRGHGHNYEAASLRDGTVMLDIEPMTGLDIDYDTRTAWAGAALSGGDLIEDLEPLGLGFPIGHCSNVPLSGYVLSGGFGWNAGRMGPGLGQRAGDRARHRRG